MPSSSTSGKGAPRNAALPRRQDTPSISPLTPPPGWARKADTGFKAPPWATIRPRAMGCSESRSRLAATCSRSASAVSEVATIRRSRGRPSVRVPVLSKARSVACPRASRAAASRTSTPFRAAEPRPTMTATGVARPRAQGQAITRRVTAGRQAWARAPVAIHHPARVSRARTRMVGTKTALMRSARSWAGALDPCACATSAAMRASWVWAPTAWISISSMEPCTTVPATRPSPTPLGTGRGSPVSMDSSTSAWPAITRPSAGTAWPGSTRARSPGCRSTTGTSTTEPSAPRRRAVGGARASSSFRASVALALARASRYLPVRRKATRAAAVSKLRWWTPFSHSATANSHATPEPSAMRVSMEAWPCRAWRPARTKKPQPAQKTTGAESAAWSQPGRWRPRPGTMASRSGALRTSATTIRRRAGAGSSSAWATAWSPWGRPRP